MEDPIDYQFSFTDMLNSTDYDLPCLTSPSPANNDLTRLLLYVISFSGRDQLSFQEDLAILEQCPLVRSLKEDEIRGYLQVIENYEQIQSDQIHQEKNPCPYINHILKCRGYQPINNFYEFNFEILESIYGREWVMLVQMHLANWSKTFELVNKLTTILPARPIPVYYVKPFTPDSSSDSSCFSTDEESKLKLFEANLKAEVNGKNPNSEEDCKDWFFFQMSKYQVDCGLERERLCQSFSDFFRIRNDHLNDYCSLFGEELGREMHKNFQKFKRSYDRKFSSKHERPKEIKRRKPRESRGLYLWQMILRLLEEPNAYEKFIRWTNRANGEFEIIDSSKVSAIWGSTKNNPKMNYEKLSRSLRQYYISSLMKKTNGKRLVYNFDMKNSQVQNFLNICQKKLPSLCPSDDELVDSLNYTSIY